MSTYITTVLIVVGIVSLITFIGLQSPQAYRDPPPPWETRIVIGLGMAGFTALVLFACIYAIFGRKGWW